MELARGHYILLGQSGTGKSSFSFRLAKRWIECNQDLKNIYVLNAGNPETDIPPGCQALEWEEFGDGKKDLTGSVVILEDLICVNMSNKLAIKKSLTYAARRQSVCLLAIVHSLHGSALMNAFQFFNHILFFGSGLNVGKSFKLLKDGGGLGPALRAEGGGILTKHAGKHGRYRPLHLDLATQEISLLDQDGGQVRVLLGENGAATDAPDPDGKPSDVLADFKEGLEAFLGTSEAELRLGKFLLRNVPRLVSDHGRASDLTLKLESVDGSPRRVSILDFCATCASPDAKPSREVKGLYKFLARSMNLPDLLVRNRHLRKRKSRRIKALDSSPENQ